VDPHAGGEGRGEVNFKHYVGTQDGREEVMWLRLQQAKRDPKYLEDYLAAFGIRRIRETFFRSTGLIQNCDQLGRAGYHFVGFSNKGVAAMAEGHAIAVDGYRNVLFDPNCGQFACASPQALQSFMYALLAEHYETMVLGAGIIKTFAR
jgi:hypothetical protein